MKQIILSHHQIYFSLAIDVTKSPENPTPCRTAAIQDFGWTQVSVFELAFLFLYIKADRAHLGLRQFFHYLAL